MEPCTPSTANSAFPPGSEAVFTSAATKEEADRFIDILRKVNALFG
jgi:hypothetical protein